ncbi:MAG: hypothetical protein WCF17_21380 [Terracidiphilus sp.]
MPRALLTAFAVFAIPCSAQFQLQTSNSTADLRGIDNVGNGVAWASGTSGTVLRTEDGGYVWQTCAIPPGAEKLDFRGIQAFDSNTAIVMSSGTGDLSRLYKTTDGCHTWKLLFTNPHKDGFWDAVKFADRKHGFLLGDPVEESGVPQKRFELEQTYDGGSSWKLWEDKIGDLESNGESCAFAASNSSLLGEHEFDTAFASGCQGGAFVFAVENSSPGFCDCHPMPSEEEWNNQLHVVRSAPAPFPGDETGGIFSIADGPGVLVAVGGDFKQPDSSSHTAAVWSPSSKVPWHAAQTPPHGYRSSVAYDPALNLWITVGPNGTDVSTDDGRNWRAVHPSAALHESPDADRNWNALSLPYVAGPHGRIGKLDPAALGK